MTNSNLSGVVQLGDEPIIKGRSGTTSNGPYTIPDKQSAYIHVGGLFPIPFEVPIPEGQSPYRPGFYVLDGASYRNGQYGLEIADRQIKLRPLEEALTDLSTLVKAGK